MRRSGTGVTAETGSQGPYPVPPLQEEPVGRKILLQCGWPGGGVGLTPQKPARTEPGTNRSGLPWGPGRGAGGVQTAGSVSLAPGPCWLTHAGGNTIPPGYSASKGSAWDTDVQAHTQHTGRSMPPTLSIPSLGLGMRCVREAFRRDPGLRVPAKLSRESGGSRPGWNAGELAARMGARLRHTQPSQRTAPAPGPSTPLPLSLLIPSPTSHDGS